MALRRIRTEGDRILRKVSKPVDEISPRIVTLLDDMIETLDDVNAVGLAAPQIGVLKRIIVIRMPRDEDDEDGEGELFEMINPVVVDESGTQRMNEACLSIPGESAYVERPQRVTVLYSGRDGAQRSLTCEDVMAVAVCHETDHLDGVLYIDKISPPRPGDEETDGGKKRKGRRI
ncbi:MAG: peptide deformylase [Clostridiales bacterium]|jgi:peptide deformylase|nr:peptide deformylase [Clostridiales bacterium]